MAQVTIISGGLPVPSSVLVSRDLTLHGDGSSENPLGVVLGPAPGFLPSADPVAIVLSSGDNNNVHLPGLGFPGVMRFTFTSGVNAILNSIATIGTTIRTGNMILLENANPTIGGAQIIVAGDGPGLPGNTFSAGIILGPGTVAWYVYDGTHWLPTVGFNEPSPVRTPEEIAAGVTPVDYRYPAGYVDRYGINTIPGVTDMTVAANDAISVMSHAGGGVVSWLAARYLVGSAGVHIDYTQSGILHRGTSRESTLIINGSADHPAITCGDGSTAIFGGGVVQMQFSQRSGVAAINGNCAVLYSHVGQFLIRDVFVSAGISAPYRGVVFTGATTGCSQFDADNLQVQSCLNDGITLILSVDPYIINCRSDANGGSGWTFNGTQGALVANCSAFSNGTVAWNLSSTNAAVAQNKNNAFVNCVGDTSGSYNWQIIDSQDSRWVGCWGGTQLSILVNTFASGWIIATAFSTRLSFTDCIAINNNAHGFQVFDNGTASTNITFDNCHYVNNGRSAGGGYGWTCNGSSNLLRVNGGSFSGNTTGPFLNQSGLPDITVTGSPIGFVSANQGTGTITVGTSSIVITHGLGVTPNLANIQITDTSSRAVSGINSVWTSTPTSTQFTVNTNTNVATANFLFVWRAAMNGN